VSVQACKHSIQRRKNPGKSDDLLNEMLLSLKIGRLVPTFTSPLGSGVWGIVLNAPTPHPQPPQRAKGE